MHSSPPTQFSSFFIFLHRFPYWSAWVDGSKVSSFFPSTIFHCRFLASFFPSTPDNPPVGSSSLNRLLLIITWASFPQNLIIMPFAVFSFYPLFFSRQNQRSRFSDFRNFLWKFHFFCNIQITYQSRHHYVSVKTQLCTENRVCVSKTATRFDLYIGHFQTHNITTDNRNINL